MSAITSKDTSDRETSGEADTEARPAMSAITLKDPSDRETSGEADTEARPAMSAITSKDPSDRETSGEADTEARPAMSAMRSKTPADDQASTGAGPVASLVMSTMRSGTPSVYQASTETGHEASFVMSTRASGTPSDQASTETGDEASLGMTIIISGTPSVNQASTETGREASPGIITTIAVPEKPRGDPAMDGASTPRVGAATPDSKVETSNEERGRLPIGWGQGIQIRPSMYLPRPSESGPSPAAPVDDASRLIINHSSVSDAITRLQKRALLSSLNHLMRLGSLFSCKDMIAEQ